MPLDVVMARRVAPVGKRRHRHKVALSCVRAPDDKRRTHTLSAAMVKYLRAVSLLWETTGPPSRNILPRKAMALALPVLAAWVK